MWDVQDQLSDLSLEVHQNTLRLWWIKLAGLKPSLRAPSYKFKGRRLTTLEEHLAQAPEDSSTLDQPHEMKIEVEVVKTEVQEAFVPLRMLDSDSNSEQEEEKQDEQKWPYADQGWSSSDQELDVSVEPYEPQAKEKPDLNTKKDSPMQAKDVGKTPTADPVVTKQGYAREVVILDPT